MDLKKLVEAGRKATTTERVSDSAERRARILDAKRRMAERRANAEEGTKEENRISDSRTPMRGVAAKRAAVAQGLRKQDSVAKTFYALRKRIKDELAETESTEEAIDAAIDIMNNEVEVAPQDVLAAVIEVISEVADTLPSSEEVAEEVAEEGTVEEAYEDEAGEEVSDSLKRDVIRRRDVSDSARREATRRRVLDAMAKRRAAARRVRDARAKRIVRKG